MLYYENTMNNTKNIILIASIAAVLGFASVALQTNTVVVYAFMDNTSEILDIGEESEITIMAPPEGKRKKTSLAGEYEVVLDDNTIKCSASNILSCKIQNSVDGLAKVTLSIDGLPCTDKDVKDGSARASINTRKTDNSDNCKYNTDMPYNLNVYLAGDRFNKIDKYTVLIDTQNVKIDIKLVTKGI